MPTKPAKMFTAWSYSRCSVHDECPARAKYQFLDKIPQGEKSPAMERGGVIDKEATEFLERRVKKLPASLKLFSREFAALLRAKAKAQVQWALTAAWQPTDWFGPQAWCRVVLDAHHKVGQAALKVVDFKTGKIYESNREQLELYALAGLANYPEVDEVETQLWYLDQGEIVQKSYLRSQLPALQKRWREKVIPILSDRRFVPRPGDYCRWCPYSKRKAGPCKF